MNASKIPVSPCTSRPFLNSAGSVFREGTPTYPVPRDGKPKEESLLVSPPSRHVTSRRDTLFEVGPVTVFEPRLGFSVDDRPAGVRVLNSQGFE